MYDRKHIRLIAIPLFLCSVVLLTWSPVSAQPKEQKGQKETQSQGAKKYGLICRKILTLLEDDLGALLTAMAGLGAIIASVMGGFKMAWSLLVVSIGSFVLRAYKEYWFPGSCR